MLRSVPARAASPKPPRCPHLAAASCALSEGSDGDHRRGDPEGTRAKCGVGIVLIFSEGCSDCHHLHGDLWSLLVVSSVGKL